MLFKVFRIVAPLYLIYSVRPSVRPSFLLSLTVSFYFITYITGLGKLLEVAMQTIMYGLPSPPHHMYTTC